MRLRITRSLQQLLKDLPPNSLKKQQRSRPHKIHIRHLRPFKKRPLNLLKQPRQLLQQRRGTRPGRLPTKVLLQLLESHPVALLAGGSEIRLGVGVEEAVVDGWDVSASNEAHHLEVVVVEPVEVLGVDFEGGLWVARVDDVGDLAAVHDVGAVGEEDGGDGVAGGWVGGDAGLR